MTYLKQILFCIIKNNKFYYFKTQIQQLKIKKLKKKFHQKITKKNSKKKK